MNSYEHPVAGRLQADAASIPLPPRERWVPTERHRPRLMPVLATLGVLTLAALVAAPVAEQLRTRNPAVGASPSASSAASGACGPAQNPPTASTCGLVPGTLVEIVGSSGPLEATTSRVRVQLDSADQSAAFGSPTLFEADARTQIDPKSPTIAATGVKVGAAVQVSFDPRAPKTPAGAYLLTQFSVVSDGRLPDCLVELDVTNPPPGPVPGTGAMSAEEAFRRTFPNVSDFKMFPQGAQSFSPVWIVAASGDTYIANILGSIYAPNNWYAFRAKFVRCHTPQEVRDREAPRLPPGSPHPDGTRG
jgi:hypothetical protein